MGYTHYFRGWVSLDESFIETVKAFIDYSGVIVESGDGEGQPSLEVEGEVCINGSVLLDQHAETFLLVQGVNHRSFCKTSREPYDVVVCAILLLATARKLGFKVSSDGNWDDEGWLAARALYTNVTGVAPIRPEEMGGPANYARQHDGGYAHSKA